MSKKLREGYLQGRKCPRCGGIVKECQNPFGTNAWLPDYPVPQYKDEYHSSEMTCIQSLGKRLTETQDTLSRVVSDLFGDHYL